MRTTRYKFCALTVSLVLLTTLGCKGLLRRPARPAGPVRLPRQIVEVSVDRDLVARRTVSVDIIGVTEVESYQWKRKPIDHYWTPRDPLRAKAEAEGIIREMEFKADSDLTEVHDRDDLPWDKWEEKRVTFLIVIADIPGVEDDNYRRLVLDRKEIGGKTIRIQVTKDGLEQVK